MEPLEGFIDSYIITDLASDYLVVLMPCHRQLSIITFKELNY